MTIDEYTGYPRGASPKEKWHRKHKKLLRQVVTILGLDPNKVHSNKAGPAIGGEVVYSDSRRALIVLACPFNGYGGAGQLLFRNDAGYCRQCSPEDKNGSYFPNQFIPKPYPDGTDYTAESLAELLRKLLCL